LLPLILGIYEELVSRKQWWWNG